jgi:hypothetical protein
VPRGHGAKVHIVPRNAQRVPAFTSCNSIMNSSVLVVNTFGNCDT